MIRLHNTLTGKKEDFIPIKKGFVGMYHCGPTVYDYSHIGNLRSYVFADILRRVCEYDGLKVKQVINITDIGHLSSDADDGEDKMTKGLKREGKPLTIEAMGELAEKYAGFFVENLKSLNIELPEEMPRASKHITEDIDLIKKLEQKGFVYKTSDGLYFDTSKDAQYGALSKKVAKIEDEQTRIGENTEKKNQRDFALWKFNENIGFKSPWEQGFPGWHIECSAMSMKYLGETFDLHTGGIDHIPVHHNNEIAQSQCATGKPLANYWLHHAHIIINSEKMSKSLGNFLKLQDLVDQGIDPLTYRYWLLGAHYSTQMDLTIETLKAAQTGYKKLLKIFGDINKGDLKEMTEAKPDEKYLTDFKKFIFDDLDTPKALALLWDLAKDPAIENEVKVKTMLEFDKVLGLGLDKIKLSSKTEKEIVPHGITKLVEERESARKKKDWKMSDELRDVLKIRGYEIKDTDEGPKVSKI